MYVRVCIYVCVLTVFIYFFVFFFECVGVLPFDGEIKMYIFMKDVISDTSDVHYGVP